MEKEKQVEVKKTPLSTNDSGWTFDETTSRKSMGIYDYSRLVEFDHSLSKEELSETERWLASNDCPGWTGVRGYLKTRQAPWVYKFVTTYDSSG